GMRRSGDDHHGKPLAQGRPAESQPDGRLAPCARAGGARVTDEAPGLLRADDDACAPDQEPPAVLDRDHHLQTVVAVDVALQVSDLDDPNADGISRGDALLFVDRLLVAL